MVRIFIDSTKRTVNLRAPGSTLVADVQDTIEHRWGRAVCAQRLICSIRIPLFSRVFIARIRIENIHPLTIKMYL